MSFTLLMVITFISAFINVMLGLYLNISQKPHKYDKLLVYLAFILSASILIVDTIYLIIGG